ncbi:MULTISPECIES: hypothetical protein [Pseudomonas]|uniref:hypothetical protein n=1 Tax=Pseudomonadaceae TaxID=135621 RepID=UPI0012DDB306|nr:MULTISPECIES: hypothetical protein [Pseudomonas]
MIIDMRTWARIGASGASARTTAPLSVLQSSINSLHLANQSRKEQLEQLSAQAVEPDPIEPPNSDTPGVPGTTDADEDVDPGDVDDQAGAGDPLNR